MADAGGPVLCVGALTLDTIFQMDALPEGPGKFLPLTAVEIAAGMASSAATAIARLGGRAALWASVGGDANGRRLIGEIASEGVDCSAVRVVGGARSAFATILVDRNGERIIVPHYDPALLAAPNVVPDMSDYAAVMVDVRWPLGAAEALAAAKSAGIPAILDADVASAETLALLTPLATHIVASKSAACRMSGQADPQGAALSLAGEFDAFVAVTAGSRGVWWVEAGQARHCPAPRIEAVDTLAAGDVFHGAFALGLVEGMDMGRLMAFASMAAAIKCERFGGRLGAPTRHAVLSRMAGD